MIQFWVAKRKNFLIKNIPICITFLRSIFSHTLPSTGAVMVFFFIFFPQPVYLMSSNHKTFLIVVLLFSRAYNVAFNGYITEISYQENEVEFSIHAPCFFTPISRQNKPRNMLYHETVIVRFFENLAFKTISSALQSIYFCDEISPQSTLLKLRHKPQWVRRLKI